jgi:WhiB family redox-sensing transcriptional regulator
MIPELSDPACAVHPTSLFYAEEHALCAKRICAGCADRDPCLLWALRSGEPFGVFGGLTAGERVRLMASAA